MAGLHDCHGCKYIIAVINGRGKKRTFCEKYGQSVERVRWHCFDRYLGFDTEELSEIKRQYRAGKCVLTVNEA
jgi:hypothetical protein